MIPGFCLLLLILSVLDVKDKVIPNVITIPLTLIFMVCLRNYLPALSALALGYLLYAKGFWCGGDAKLGCMISAFAGWSGLLAVALTAGIIKVYGLMNKGRMEIPVAPIMSLACVFMLGLRYI